MSPKLIAVAIALTLGTAPGAPALAAGDPPATSNKRIIRQNSEDLLARAVFQTLLGEFALRQGDVKLAADVWTDLAQRANDPLVASRATEIAIQAKQYERALELSKLWQEIDPESLKARQTEASLLILTGRIDDVAPQLAKLLSDDKDNLASNFLHLNRMLARLNNNALAQRLIDRLADPYGELPEAHFAMAQAAANNNDSLRAIAEIEEALRLRTDWESAALLRAQLQAQLPDSPAISKLQEFVTRYPAANNARLVLARLQVSEKRYNDARKNFEYLLQSNPDNPEIMYPVAMLALQTGDTESGRLQLERLLQTDFPDKSAVHFLLGQLSHEQNQPDAALAHFRAVESGEQYIAARTRAAQILVQQGKTDEAKTMLQGTRGANPAQRTQLTLAEAQILREAGRHSEAFGLLDKALNEQPNNVDLLYDAALTAERIGKPELLESYLKRLLKIQPEHPHALNALGYSLAERNIRLDEAFQLITQALTLTPEDPFILDSLGWVQYRQGKLAESLLTLEKAYRLKADPEIATHLAEVLTAQNRQADARSLIDAALKAHPGNSLLVEAARKLQP